MFVQRKKSHFSRDWNNSLHFGWTLLKETSWDWWEDNTFRMAAAIAFYTIFSLAPVLIVTEWIGSLLLDEIDFTVRRDLANELGILIGAEGAKAIEVVLEQASASVRTPFGLLVSLFTILIGSTMVFLELQSGLNEIWGVKPKLQASIVKQFLMARVRSFGIAMMVGLLLVTSLVLSTILQIFQRRLDEWIPSGAWLWSSLNFATWILLVAMLFAMIYKFLPDVRLPWRNVILGAVVTSLLFSFGKFIIAIYLGHATFASAYGAAGSFVVFLVWVYYSALICLYGAEFTHAYTRLRGDHPPAEEFAEPEKSGKGEDLLDAKQVPSESVH